VNDRDLWLDVWLPNLLLGELANLVVAALSGYDGRDLVRTACGAFFWFTGCFAASMALTTAFSGDRP
jgi:hypothetical protein